MSQSLLSGDGFNIKPDFVEAKYVGIYYGEPVELQYNHAYFTPTSQHWYSFHSVGPPLMITPFVATTATTHANPLKGLIVGMSLYAGLTLVLLHSKNLLISLTLVAIFLYEWWRRDRSKVSAIALFGPFIICLVAYAVKIHQRYGTWIIAAPFSNGQLFHFLPRPALLAGWFDTTKGLLPNNPIYLLILIGLSLWWHRHRRSLVIVTIVLIPSLLIQSTLNDWAGGYSPIGRYLMPMVLALTPAMAFAVGAFLKRTWTKVLLALLIVGQLAMTLTNILKYYQWNNAGQANPLYATLQGRFHLPHSLSAPIFGYNLDVQGTHAYLYLGGGLLFATAAFAYGILLVRQQDADK